MTDEIEKERLAALAEADIDDPENYLPGSMGCHEALHTSWIMMDTFSRHLLEHPSILLDADLYAQTSKIHSALFDLYQSLGAKHLADENDA